MYLVLRIVFQVYSTQALYPLSRPHHLQPPLCSGDPESTWLIGTQCVQPIIHPRNGWWGGWGVVCVGLFGGDLFELRLWASNGNDYSTLLFATTHCYETMISIFSRYPKTLGFVITGSVGFLFEYVK